MAMIHAGIRNVRVGKATGPALRALRDSSGFCPLGTWRMVVALAHPQRRLRRLCRRDEADYSAPQPFGAAMDWLDENVWLGPQGKIPSA